ncbi:MAG: putative ABC transporter [Anaerolineaceae bacterium 46_22]|jgi:ATP-binding cassette subfamily B protein|nr:MAG: putative ABC transporter [Anaerolineaceae bacterium 46_22]
MGFFSGLAAEKYDRQYSDRKLISRIFDYFKNQSKRLIIIGISIVLHSVIEAYMPVIVANGLDRVTQETITNKYVFTLSGIILLLGVLSWFTNLLRRRYSARTIAELIRELATDAFQASVRQDLSFHDHFQSGKIVSRITSDTREFGQLITLSTDVFMQVITSVILAVVLLQTEWRLALAVFLLIPIIFYLVMKYRHAARQVTRDGMRAMANVNSTIKETVSGIAIAKNFRQEDKIYEEFDEANQTSYKVNIKRGLILSFVFPVLRTIGGIATALMIYFGAMTVLEGFVSAGAWYLFLSTLDRFLMPVMSISSFWTNVQTGFSAAERIFALIDAEHSVIQNNSIIPESLQGRIDMINVDFSYTSEEAVLKDFTLHIEPGETLALVGHTGAGKTSIGRLIARFYEFQSGKIYIDNVDIRDFDLVSLRRHMGIVSQVPFLFSGTVQENIRYGCPRCSREEILNIGRKIGDGEWLDTLPNGLDTQVGERGSQLSMGQRQLVALMRVLIQKPSIFILDEATASIDPFTETQIQTALDMILSETTSILIAHRLSTVRSADRILVMSNGDIIEEGNHDFLIAKGTHYAELYNTYFRHQSLEYVEETKKYVKK